MKNNIIERIQNFLYSFYAKDVKDARINEIYHGLCHCLMEVIGKRWVEAKKTHFDENYYILSFEYMPGRFLENNIRKLKIEDKIREALKDLGFSYEEILSYEEEPSIGNGEIGIGSSYILNELTKRNIKTLAYSLRYEGGNMRQVIKNGMQVEVSDHWLNSANKWEHKKGFYTELEIDGKKLKATAYDMPVLSDKTAYVNTLRLWSSNPISKIDFQDFSRGDLIKAYDDYIMDSSITQFLYLDNSTYEGKFLRLKQEYFYAYACVHDIFRRYFKNFKDVEKIKDKIKILVSDVHPALALVEFVKVLYDQYAFTYKKAIEFSRNIFEHFVFLITEDSHEEYDLSMVEKLNMDFYKSLVEINDFLIEENPKNHIINNSKVSLNNINKYLSKEYLISSQLIYQGVKKKDKIKLKNINFGIDRDLYGSSCNKRLAKFLYEYGIDDFSVDKIRKVSNLYMNNSFIDGLEELKIKNKKSFIEKYYKKESRLNPYSIFDIQATNFHEAKRQLLNALSIADLYYRLKENSSLDIVPTTYIFSGKANEGYYIAKESIKFILALKKMIEKDRLIKEKIKILFVENLNVSKSRILYPICDIYSNLTLPLYDNNGFEILASCMNFSNVVTSKGGISNNQKEPKHSFYLIGQDLDKLERDRSENSYQANNYYYSHERVRNTVDYLIKEDYDNFSYNFKTIYDYLINYNDSFYIFKDMEEVSQKRIEISKDYLNKNLWVKNEIDNILWANEFYLGENAKNIVKRSKI
ncbi:MAG: glycogen/starch/alpha-glucan phosphorylase [Peptoniphilaceae bacterium]|nr:glycogen/starch/alpha-glucan phosphorylase [Peptoniphilaceae bacterium]MDY6018028.1 glycogen/starch/alpha-glucan phosphorylase [Anaerococcus sp.]